MLYIITYLEACCHPAGAARRDDADERDDGVGVLASGSPSYIEFIFAGKVLYAVA